MNFFVPPFRPYPQTAVDPDFVSPATDTARRDAACPTTDCASIDQPSCAPIYGNPSASRSARG